MIQSQIDELIRDNKLMKAIMKAGMIEAGEPQGEHWMLAAALAALVKERDDAISKINELEMEILNLKSKHYTKKKE